MKKLIAAIVLAAMIAPAYGEDWDFLKPLGDFFDMLDRSWLGSAVANYDPNGWNGVWPNRLYFEPGGVIKEHIERWQELERSGSDVEILGPCYSACTLIVAYVPKERLCFGVFASPQFHLAWVRFAAGGSSLDQRVREGAGCWPLGPSCVSPALQLKREWSPWPEFGWFPANLRDFSKA